MHIRLSSFIGTKENAHFTSINKFWFIMYFIIIYSLFEY